MANAFTSSRSTQERRQGFTLVELAIVLVIIGLIIGGVLVGQDMIKAAEIRATIGQYEKYNTALNVFRNKYNGLPGDLAAASATAFGLGCGGMAGTGGLGDGNGLITGGTSSAINAALGETACFWRHLSDAQLIDGNLGSTLTAAGAPASPFTALTYLPAAKSGRGNYFAVFATGGLNYYQLGPFATVTDASGVYTFGTTGLTPTEAFNIDSKLDDGLPVTGIVTARALGSVNGASSANAASTASTCTIGTGVSTDTFNRVAATGGNDPSCALRLRFN